MGCKGRHQTSRYAVIGIQCGTPKDKPSSNSSKIDVRNPCCIMFVDCLWIEILVQTRVSQNAPRLICSLFHPLSANNCSQYLTISHNIIPVAFCKQSTSDLRNNPPRLRDVEKNRTLKPILFRRLYEDMIYIGNHKFITHLISIKKIRRWMPIHSTPLYMNLSAQPPGPRRNRAMTGQGASAINEKTEVLPSPSNAAITALPWETKGSYACTPGTMHLCDWWFMVDQ